MINKKESCSLLKTHRRPLFIAIFTFIFYGVLALTLFAAEQQFAKYPQAAAQYLAHTLPPERLLDFSPFYLYLHVAQQAALPSGDWVILLLQLLAVSAAAGLLFLLLQRFVTTKIALVAVVAFVFSRSLMVYVCIFEPEAFLVAFLIGFLFFVSQEGRKRWLMAGSLLALALAIRPSVLPLLGLIPLCFRLNRGEGRWVTPTALVLIPALLLLFGLAIRNGTVSGDYSPLGMNPGFVFFEGNNPLSTGKSAVYPPIVGELKNELGDQPDNPHMTYRLIADRVSGVKSSSTANRYWWQKGINFITDYPGHFVSLLATKGYFILHSYQRHDLFAAFSFAQRLRAASIPSLPFAALALLALWGMVLARRRWRQLLLFYALLLSQVALMLLLYVSERQKLALMPCLIVFAAIAAQQLWTVSGKMRLSLGLGIAVLTISLSWPNNLMREEEHLWAGYAASDLAWGQALRWREAGRFAEAGQAAARGYGAAPWLRDYARPEVLPFVQPDFAGQALATLRADDQTPSQRFDRAQLLLATGEFSAAEEILLRLQSMDARFDRVYLQSSQPAYYLAEIAMKRGEMERAVALLETGLAAAPGDPFILAQLVAITGKESYRQQIVRYFSEIDASFLIGMAQLQAGKGRDAAVNLAETSRLLPELRRAKIYHAAALGAQGEEARGAELYLTAIAEKREPVLLEKGIVSIFAELAASGEPQALCRFGLVLAQYGRFAEALQVLRTAAATSTQPEIVRTLAEVEDIARLAQR